MTKRGYFITFEGPEGSGKSSHARPTAYYLEKLGHKVLLTREPGGTRTGEKIRGLLQHETTDEEMGIRTEVLLFQASRAQIVYEVIMPALKRNEVVLCDRYGDSSVAYQGYGREIGAKQIQALNRFSTCDLVPDLTFLFDIPAKIGLERVSARREGKDRIERATLNFHERVRQGYLEMARQEPSRFYIISTLLPFDVVQGAVEKAIRERLHLG